MRPAHRLDQDKKRINHRRGSEMTAADQHIAVHGALQNVAVVSPLLMLAPRLTFSSSCRDPRARASGLLSGVLEGSPPTCAAGAKKFQVRGACAVAALQPAGPATRIVPPTTCPTIDLGVWPGVPVSTCHVSASGTHSIYI